MQPRRRNRLALTAAVLIAGCGRQDPCVTVGPSADHAANLAILSESAEALGLPTSELEIAFISGAAYAAGQLEAGQAGAPVKVCLRPGADDATEFRVLTDTNKGSTEWLSTARVRKP